MAGAEEHTGPTARRIVLGARLRRLREAAGVSREDAGYLIRGSASKISRLELGRVGYKERDVADLLTQYGVDDEEERAQLLGLAREASSPGWWDMFDEHALPSWFETYVGLEAAATTLRTLEVQLVPGLLQTEEYARAAMASTIPPVAERDIDDSVHVRLQRQRLLTKDDPLTMWAIIDEGVLHRPLGGRAAFKRQLQHLIEMGERRNITLQLLPLRHGGHIALGGGFVILRFDEPELPDVVYLEQLVSSLYIDKPDQVGRYAVVMEGLSARGRSPKATIDRLAEVLKES